VLAPVVELDVLVVLAPVDEVVPDVSAPPSSVSSPSEGQPSAGMTRRNAAIRSCCLILVRETPRR
jgi:hypothetical protein